MKILKINEEQYKKLIEGSSASEAPNFEGKCKEYNGNETTTTQNTTDSNGDYKRPKPVKTDDVSDMMTLQNYWFSGNMHSRKI